MTGADVSGLISAINSKDGMGNFGQNWIWIIGLLIIAGIFGGDGFFGRGSNSQVATTQDFIQRDIFNTNSSVLTGNSATQNEILNNRYNCSQNYSNLRYDNAMGQAGINNSIMLGNQAIQSTMAQNALSNQASQAACCCELKTAIHAEGEATRAQAADFRMRDLEKQVSGYELVAALGNQTNTLSSRFGNWYPNPPFAPYYYGSYGTTII